MAHEYAKAFYESQEWKKARLTYLMSQHFICERCGRPAVIVHHKKYINPSNINNPDITLNTSNFEALCQDCHNEQHSSGHSTTLFNSTGDVVKVKEPRAARAFKEARDQIDDVISKARKIYAFSVASCKEGENE